MQNDMKNGWGNLFKLNEKKCELEERQCQYGHCLFWVKAVQWMVVDGLSRASEGTVRTAVVRQIFVQDQEQLLNKMAGNMRGQSWVPLVVEKGDTHTQVLALSSHSCRIVGALAHDSPLNLQSLVTFRFLLLSLTFPSMLLFSDSQSKSLFSCLCLWYPPPEQAGEG